MAVKRVTLGDFLTDGEIRQCVAIYRTDRDNFHKRVLKEVINPNMERIDIALGQENDADYLAYCVQYAIGHMTG